MRWAAVPPRPVIPRRCVYATSVSTGNTGSESGMATTPPPPAVRTPPREAGRANPRSRPPPPPAAKRNTRRCSNPSPQKQRQPQTLPHTQRNTNRKSRNERKRNGATSPVTQTIAAMGFVYTSCSIANALKFCQRLRYSSAMPTANAGRCAASPRNTSTKGQPCDACHTRLGASSTAASAVAYRTNGERNTRRSGVCSNPTTTPTTGKSIEYLA